MAGRNGRQAVPLDAPRYKTQEIAQLAVAELAAAREDREAWVQVANLASVRLGLPPPFELGQDGEVESPDVRAIRLRSARVVALAVGGAAFCAVGRLIDGSPLDPLGQEVSWSPVLYALLFVFSVWIATRWAMR